MTADLCPHCFAPARDNGRPGCACAARAAAAAAAAGDSEDHIRDDRDGIRDSLRENTREGMRESMREDTRDGFDDEIRDDPMGPRPYVTFAGEERRKGPELRDIRLFERMTTRRSAREDHDAHDADAELEQTGRDQAGRADGADGAAAGAGRARRDAGRDHRTAAAAGAAAVTQAFEPVTQPIDRISPVNRTDRIGAAEAARTEADASAPAGGGAGPGTGRHRKSRRGPVVAVLSGAAAVAVASTLAFGTGLLGGDKKHDQEADRTLSDPSSSAPDDDPSTKDDKSPDKKPSPSASSTTPATTPSAAKKESASPRPSHSPSASKSKAPSKSATSPTPSATDATGSVSPGPTETPTPTGPPVLQEGDSGSEVVELQKRLGQLLLYLGSSDGEYDDGVRNAVTSFQNTYGVEGDPKGVYGPNTRRALESRTDEP